MLLYTFLEEYDFGGKTIIPFTIHGGSGFSGIILSREVFAFLPISGGVAMERSLHILSAFWGFAGMAFHLGLHWNMVLGLARNAVGTETPKTLRTILRITAVLVTGYGLYAFVKNQFLSYMFFVSSFVFFDFERPYFNC